MVNNSIDVLRERLIMKLDDQARKQLDKQLRCQLYQQIYAELTGVFGGEIYWHTEERLKYDVYVHS